MQENKLFVIDASAGLVLLRELRSWGISIAEVARRLGVSRQFAWQVLHMRIPVSEHTLSHVTRAARECIAQRCLSSTPGARMRRARINAGLTLKKAASLIGYSWVAVERWEMDICVPKPGVLWHLKYLYRVDEEWNHRKEITLPFHTGSEGNAATPVSDATVSTPIALRA